MKETKEVQEPTKRPIFIHIGNLVGEINVMTLEAADATKIKERIKQLLLDAVAEVNYK